jgi:putative SOS response-associated peptidase YedK
MCGRYSLICIDDLGNRFRVFDPMLGCKSKFNVAPSQLMPVVVQRGKIEMEMMQWGLIPHGVKNPQDSPHPINARAETLSETPIFRDLLAQNRCLVPASGFYEWLKEGTRKVPFYIHVKERPIIAFAGLYDIWRDCYGEPYPTFTIVTTDANTLVYRLHERMPVILRQEDETRWLSGPAPTFNEMREILGPYQPGEMEAYPVSPRVNSPSVDDAQLIRPIATL